MRGNGAGGYPYGEQGQLKRKVLGNQREADWKKSPQPRHPIADRESPIEKVQVLFALIWRNFCVFIGFLKLPVLSSFVSNALHFAAVRYGGVPWYSFKIF